MRDRVDNFIQSVVMGIYEQMIVSIFVFLLCVVGFYPWLQSTFGTRQEQKKLYYYTEYCGNS